MVNHIQIRRHIMPTALLFANPDRVKGWGQTNSPRWQLPPPCLLPPSHLPLPSTQQFWPESKQQEDPGLIQHPPPLYAWHAQEMCWTRRATIPRKSMIFIFLTWYVDFLTVLRSFKKWYSAAGVCVFYVTGYNRDFTRPQIITVCLVEKPMLFFFSNYLPSVGK